jgi:hypothetical protein
VQPGGRYALVVAEQLRGFVGISFCTADALHPVTPPEGERFYRNKTAAATWRDDRWE